MESKKYVEVYGKKYELFPCQTGLCTDILGTPYEFSESSQGGFNVYRIAPDGIAEPIGEGLSSEEAAVEISEIFERLLQFVISSGYVSQLSTIEGYIHDWRENPPHRILDENV